ncbi:MAG: hypothetical protein M3Q16_05085 [Pseudomonadota bacterium]|nr:hypothetical protein [Pseudomonadota bacterium]
MQVHIGKRTKQAQYDIAVGKRGCDEADSHTRALRQLAGARRCRGGCARQQSTAQCMGDCVHAFGMIMQGI